MFEAICTNQPNCHMLCCTLFVCFLLPTSICSHTTQKIITTLNLSNMSNFQCSTCQLSLKTKGQKDHHQSNCKDFVDIQIGGGKVTLTRNADGMFLCPCTGSNCSRLFKQISTLKKHISKFVSSHILVKKYLF